MFSRAFPVLILVFLLIAVQNVTAQTEEPPSQILFNNVNIFDGKNRELQEGSSVLVEGCLRVAKRGRRCDVCEIPGLELYLAPRQCLLEFSEA